MSARRRRSPASAPADTGVTCVVLSGGNVDPLLLMRVLRYGMASAGRFLQQYGAPAQAMLDKINELAARTGSDVVTIDADDADNQHRCHADNAGDRRLRNQNGVRCFGMGGGIRRRLRVRYQRDFQRCGGMRRIQQFPLRQG